MRIAWISEYPIEWMNDAPDEIRKLPKHHPATWLRVLSAEFSSCAGIDLHVIALRNNIKENHSFVVDRVTFHVLKVPRYFRTPSFFLVDTWVIKKKLREIQPDMVHAWGSERGAALVASRLGYPYLVTMQGILSWYRQLIRFEAYDRFTAILEELALRRARFVTTECTFAARYLSGRYPRASIIQAEHAPNWLFHNVQRRPQTEPIRFIFVGTPGFRKGTDLLLLALNQLVSDFDFELIIVGGGGEFLSAISQQLDSRMLKRVKIIPGLPPEGVAEELARATILLLPTRADTSPNAVKEAVVAGVPVVASAIGGVVDYVIPGLNGFVFESGNLKAMVDALRMAVEHPLIGRGLVDADCLSKMRHYLSPTQMKDNFATAYRQVLQSVC